MRDITTPVLLGDFKIDPVTQELTCTTGHQSVKLSRSESLIICMLAEQPNVAVSRDALLEACWTGKVVTNGSLTVAIKHIRSAFSQLGADDVIITEPKKGYLIRLTNKNNTGNVANEEPPAITELTARAEPGVLDNSVEEVDRQPLGINLSSRLYTLSQRYLVTAAAFLLTVFTLSHMALFVESTRIDKHSVLYDGQAIPPAVVNAIKSNADPKARMIAYPVGGICDSYQLIAIDKQSGFTDLSSRIEQGDCHG